LRPVIWWDTVRNLILVATAIALLTAALFDWSTHPAMASATQLATVNQDLIAKRVPIVDVDSIDAANKVLISQWTQAPPLPELPTQHVTACAIDALGNKRVACVLLDQPGGTITMTIARAADMAMPPVPIISQGALTCGVQSVSGLNMVLLRRNGNWVCLMGRVSQPALMELAGGLQF
jgi:hypothetical protein